MDEVANSETSTASLEENVHLSQKQANGKAVEDQIAEKLRQNSVRFFECLNQGQIGDVVFQTMAPDFTMHCEKFITPYTYCGSRDEFLSHFVDVLKQTPGYYVNITHSTVNMSDSNRKAAAMLSGDTGVGEVRIDVVHVLWWEWRKVEGWICVRGKCVRALSMDSMDD